jgi:hypothetical protein
LKSILIIGTTELEPNAEQILPSKQLWTSFWCASSWIKYFLQNPDKSRLMRWAGHVARMGEVRKLYKVLEGKPEGKRPLGRPWRRWGDGIRMDLREIVLGWCGLDSTGSG